MDTIAANLQAVHTRIAAACQQVGRNVAEVTLLAVSKTFGVQAVRAAHAAGQRAFGENYVQEGVDKILALRDLPGIAWHMIGPLQSNKTRLVAEHFDWVHSIDRLKIAQRLSEQRPAHLPPLQVCIQVNIDAGANKAGVSAADAPALAREVAALPRLALRGIMVIPEPAPDFVAARAVFMLAKGLFDSIKTEHPGVDTLSMGMSADVDAAVAAGSTMLRVGSAIFGDRASKHSAQAASRF
jgi:PLP dependent protein